MFIVYEYYTGRDKTSDYLKISLFLKNDCENLHFSCVCGHFNIVKQIFFSVETVW